MAWREKEFEEKMTPFIDRIYYKLFKDRLPKDGIHRSSRDTEDDKRLFFMDVELAIDTHLRFANGEVLTFQEKTRRHQYRHYQEFTFEYYNDPSTKDEGEWFKLASQFYFYGYANKQQNGYSEYWIINVGKLRTGLMKRFTIGYMERNWLRYNRPPAKANFFAIPFAVLDSINGVIVYKNTEVKDIHLHKI